MGDNLFTPSELAQMAGLFVMHVPSHGVVRVVHEHVLEVGPEASADEIVTVAFRALLMRRCPGAPVDEELVRDAVREHGYEYVEPSAPVTREPAQNANQLSL